MSPKTPSERRGESKRSMGVADALTLAVGHHRAGRLESAASIYKQIIKARGDQPDALHLLGVLYHQRGRHEAAGELIQSVSPAQPGDQIADESTVVSRG